MCVDIAAVQSVINLFTQALVLVLAISSDPGWEHVVVIMTEGMDARPVSS